MDVTFFFPVDVVSFLAEIVDLEKLLFCNSSEKDFLLSFCRAFLEKYLLQSKKCNKNNSQCLELEFLPSTSRKFPPWFWGHQVDAVDDQHFPFLG